MDSELRKRFNPDGSLLRRQQLRMLELLEVIDVICRKHQIPYWLSSGTLIGAARHKGFIPWDDDLDIEMLRSDYLRLLKVLPQELPDNLALQTNETDPNYIFIYGKLRDKDSHLEETNSYDRIFHYTGIYIDIFPLEKIPYCLAWIGRHKQGQIYKQMKKKNIRKKRATAQQSIVSLSCLVCIAFAAIWGFHAGSGNSRAVEAKKMSASSSVAENESSEINADNSSQAESMVDESGIDESLTDSSVTHYDADDLSDAVFIGDSRTVGLQNNCDKPKATFLCSVGMHIDTVMTDQNITLSNGNAGTVIDALGE